ncbi:MAG: tight adherence protein [Chloroflexota bacterium]|nr:tight adherence protein [Chloroflexota bacterium]
MITTIGLVLAGVGFVYLVVTALLPILQSSRVDPYSAHTGGGESAATIEAARYISPTERLLAPFAGAGFMERYRKPVDIGADFRWGSFLDRQVSVFLIAIGLSLVIFKTPVLAIIVGLAGPAIDYSLALRRARAYRAKFLIQLPNALLLVSSGMAAGRNFVNALQATTPNLAEPIKSELVALADRISMLRVTEAEAFEIWAEKLPYPELHTIASALAIGQQVGLETFGLLRSLSSSIQDDIRGRSELEAVTSQVRSTATVVSYLPVFFVLFIYLVVPHFITPLFTTVVGIVVIFIAFGMNYISRLATKRILKQIES